MSAAAPHAVRVRVPATSANLGPGFDCLGLALDLWNETTFTPEGEGLRMTTEGEGRALPTDERNMVLQAMRFFCDTRGLPFPRGLTIHCRNSIPAGSGLGSSAAAVVTGLLGASALLNAPMDEEEALMLSARMEGHADNAAAALFGGLVIVAAGKGNWLLRRIPIPPLEVVVVLPSIDLPTHMARAALPGDVALKDVTYNLGRALLVVEALREGNLDLLRQAMDDRLHLPFRLPLIPGGQHALDAACAAGASAVTISGAGPSLIAFTGKEPDDSGKTPASAVADAMVGAFRQRHVSARAFLLNTSSTGAAIETLAQG